MFKVQAILQCYIDNKLRPEGKVFMIKSEKEFSKNCMKSLDPKLDKILGIKTVKKAVVIEPVVDEEALDEMPLDDSETEVIDEASSDEVI